MAESPETLPKATPELRQTVAKLYARAKQVLASGDLDYAIELLLDCCKRDPSNILLRKELRAAEKNKYQDNKKGKSLAFLSTWRPGIQMETFAKTGKYLRAIEQGEEVLKANPWHVRAHIVMAQSFDKLGLKDLALWTLDQARQVDDQNPTVNRHMALLFEERGQFTQAIALWRLVAKALPKDQEAGKKAMHLAASETIAKGKYDQAVTGDAPTPTVQAPRTSVEDETPSASLAEQRMAKEAGLLLKRIEETPTNANAYHQLAQLYRRNDMHDKAREILKKGLVASGNNFDLSLELTDLDIDAFRRDLTVTEEKLRADPKNVDLANVRAKLVKEINVRELAFYRQRSDRYPTDAAARFEMAVRLYKTGQTDEAIQEFQKIAKDPKHKVRVSIYLGLCFRSRNNWRLAQRNFEDALQHLTANEEGFRKEIMFQLATGYSENGELTRAVELGCELANLDYGYKDIGNLIEKWQAKAPKT